MLKISNSKFNFNGQKFKIILEEYFDVKAFNRDTRTKLNDEIHNLLMNCWGKFPSDFIQKHIFGSDKMIIARLNGEPIGLCVMSIREIEQVKIHYIEFLLVNKSYQKSGLGSFLSFMIIRREIQKNILPILFGKPLEIFFITPNIRILSHMARFASFIYPNPYSADANGYIYLADEETWRIANLLLKQSDNPGRVLRREGLVLEESYAETPWLIYNNDNAPWHSDEKVNLFAKKYLGYHISKDREFMVRAHINIFSVFRYLVFKLK